MVRLFGRACAPVVAQCIPQFPSASVGGRAAASRAGSSAPGVDSPRTRRRGRTRDHGGLFQITSLDTEHAGSVASPNGLIQISDALDELAAVEPELAEIIELKFFCGFSFAEIAAMRGVSERTIQRGWEKRRLYLHHAIGSTGPALMDSSITHAAHRP
jgi:hypothetical protein